VAEQKRLLVIGCEVLARELQFVAAGAPRPVDLKLLTQGLHGVEKPGMAEDIQKHIDAADPALYDAVALAYALCNNGVVGLAARSLPVTIPRAHDCIALLLGSHARYQREFEGEPGTYYFSPGWLERDRADMMYPPSGPRVTEVLGMDRSHAELVARYGEENAEFIREQLKGGLEHYTRAAYIAPPFAVPGGFEASARARADEHGWKYQRLEGDLALLKKLLRGDWPPEEFLVLESGQRLAAGDPGADIMRGEDPC